MDDELYRFLRAEYRSAYNKQTVLKRVKNIIAKLHNKYSSYSDEELIYTLNRASDDEALQDSMKYDRWTASDMYFLNNKLCEPGMRISQNKVEINGNEFYRIVNHWFYKENRCIMIMNNIIPEFPCICEDEKGNRFTLGYDIGFEWEDIIVSKKRFPHKYHATITVPIGGIDFKSMGNLFRYIGPLTADLTYEFPNGGLNNYIAVMKEIKSEIENDNVNLLEYITIQKEKYKNHEYALEIAKECDEIINSYTGADSIRYEECLDAYKAIEMATVHYTEGDFETALKIAEELYNKAENINDYQDDNVNEYHSFCELMEEILYETIDKPQKRVIDVDFPFAQIYKLYGALLIDLKQYEKALECLKMAMKWNPVNIYIRSEYAQAVRLVHGISDEYKEIVTKSTNYAYRRRDMALCLRNIGSYIVEKFGPNFIAYGVYKWSLIYEPDNAIAINEMNYIKSQKEFSREPTMYEFLSAINGVNVQICYNEIVKKLAIEYYMLAMDSDNTEVVEYFKEIVDEIQSITPKMLPFKERIKEITGE